MSIQLKKLYLMLSRVIFVIGVGSCIGIYTNSNMENPTVLDILLMIVLLVLLFGGTSILGHYIKSIVFIEINDGQAQMQLLSGRLVNFACSDVKKVEKKKGGYRLTMASGKKYHSSNWLSPIIAGNMEASHTGLVQEDFPDAEFVA